MNRSLVDAELQEAMHVSKKRKGYYTVEQVRLVTDDARQYGAMKAGKKHPTVKVSTIETWLAYWRKNAKYYEPGAKKHGRPSFLSPSQTEDVLQSLEALGQAPNGKSVRSRTAAAIIHACHAFFMQEYVKTRSFLITTECHCLVPPSSPQVGNN